MGIGGVIQKLTPKHKKLKRKTFTSILDMRLNQNPYSGELAVFAHALGLLPRHNLGRIVLLTRNKVAMLILRNP